MKNIKTTVHINVGTALIGSALVIIAVDKCLVPRIRQLSNWISKKVKHESN